MEITHCVERPRENGIVGRTGKMIGIYLSGTGNTKHCVEALVNLLDTTARCIPLETPDITDTLKKHSTIILGYPTQFSNAPFWCEILSERTAACGMERTCSV